MSPSRRVLTLGLLFWSLFGTAFLSGCSSTLPDKRILQYLNRQGFGKRYYGKSQEQNYVSLGDTITFIDTYNQDEVKGTQQVDIDGTILLPQVGAVWVAGLTRTELESLLTQKLSPYYVETDVKVSLKSGNKKVFWVMGEVRNPGPQPYTGDITVFEAVLRAAPSTHGANLSRVKVIRADPRNPLIIPLNVTALWETGDSTYNIQVEEYDIIYVPPTLLQSIADFLAGLFVPVTSAFRDVFRALLLLDEPRLLFGGRRFNNNNVLF